jgi:hypothetical protein
MTEIDKSRQPDGCDLTGTAEHLLERRVFRE